jgi:hypothetical protein
MKALNRLLRLIGVALFVSALADQFRRPKEERTWHGEVAGMVPYDFRWPTLTRVRERWWNPDDPRLFTPHVFGVGWSLNLYRLVHREEPPSEDSESKAA